MTEDRTKISLAALQAKRQGGGLICPKCGCADLRVGWVRHTDPGMDRRKRRCRHCGYEFLTYEHAGMFSPAGEGQKTAEKLHPCNKVAPAPAEPIDRPKKTHRVKAATKGRTRRD
jgi:hypothetical protein